MNMRRPYFKGKCKKCGHSTLLLGELCGSCIVKAMKDDPRQEMDTARAKQSNIIERK